MLKDYEDDVENWLKEVGWSSNPFTLRIEPSLFVGYQDEIKKVALHLREGHKVGMITGSTGSGKTTFLKFLEKQVKDEYLVIYISKPPKEDELLEIFLEKIRPSILERIFGRKVRLHDLHVYINRRIPQRKILLLVDEVHEAEVDTLEWLRTICDQVENMQMILAGLPTLDEVLRKNLETLRSRVVTKIELLTLSREDTRELMRRRIMNVGGKDIEPFNDEVVSEIYRKTGGFPREILKICNDLVQEAIENKEFEIKEIPSETENVTKENTEEPDDIEHEEDSEEVRQSDKEEEPKINKNFLRDLTYKQRKIVDLLLAEEELYPSELAEKMGFEKYKSKQHAVRSINNILKRLKESDIVDRKPKGKGYTYFLTIKARTLLTKK